MKKKELLDLNIDGIVLGSGWPEPLSANLIKFSGSVRAEAPSPSLEKFDGNLKVKGMDKELPLSMDQFMMNGTVLKNTSWVLTICVFTGLDTRMMCNS